MAGHKKSSFVAVLTIAAIVSITAYVLMTADSSNYKSKLVPDKAPERIHHPWLSGKKKNP